MMFELYIECNSCGYKWENYSNLSDSGFTRENLDGYKILVCVCGCENFKLVEKTTKLSEDET